VAVLAVLVVLADAEGASIAVVAAATRAAVANGMDRRLRDALALSYGLLIARPPPDESRRAVGVA
jgi:hypothetical protein